MKAFSLAVFFCKWYILSETILRYWFSWKVSIKVLSCTSLVSNLSNKSNKIFPYDLISLFQTVRCIIFSFNTNNFRTKQENIIINTDWKFDLKNEMDCLPTQHQYTRWRIRQNCCQCHVVRLWCGDCWLQIKWCQTLRCQYVEAKQLILHMTQLLVLGKLGYGRGPNFKVVLEC